MPAYNHTKRGVVNKTREFVTMYQDGSLHCSYSPCAMKYIGKSSLSIQRHFEFKHGFEFGHLIFEWLSDWHYLRNHMTTEGISA